MTVKLICVGKLKEPYWRDAVAEYQKRLSRYCKLELIELADEPGGDSPSAAEIDRLLEREAMRILPHAEPCAARYAMCIEGREMTSEGLAEQLAADALDGRSSIAFVIGGSWGLHGSVKRQCCPVSMGRMTFPHQLARVMLLEQIYRAFKIQRGETYHK